MRVRMNWHRLLKVRYLSMRLKSPRGGMEFPLTPTLSHGGERELRAGKPAIIYATLAAKCRVPPLPAPGEGMGVRGKWHRLQAITCPFMRMKSLHEGKTRAASPHFDRW
jgi:hypothetical protein